MRTHKGRGELNPEMIKILFSTHSWATAETPNGIVNVIFCPSNGQGTNLVQLSNRMGYFCGICGMKLK